MKGKALAGKSLNFKTIDYLTPAVARKIAIARF